MNVRKTNFKFLARFFLFYYLYKKMKDVWHFPLLLVAPIDADIVSRIVRPYAVDIDDIDTLSIRCRMVSSQPPGIRFHALEALATP